MKKSLPLNMRIDQYTQNILDGLMDKTGEDKSKVVRQAIEFYAMYVLGQEEVMNIKLYEHFNKQDSN